MSWEKRNHYGSNINDNAVTSTTETWSANKINASLHLSNLRDVNAADKTNDYVIVYETASNKFVLKPVPRTPVVLESVTAEPVNAEVGRMWLRSDL